jgi:hypothetical protein
MTSKDASGRVYPDGLDLHTIDALIAGVYDEIRSAPRLTSALMDGTAAERRQRRMARRAIALVVCALPAAPVATNPDGEVAA